MAVDRQFARLVDYIALQGTETALQAAATKTFGHTPRPALLRFLAAAFSSRRNLFHSPDWSAAPDDLLIKASEPLCNRALGYAPIEHPPLPQHAWNLLRSIGRAGSSGALQAELAKATNLSPVMVSHYLGTLSARRLVARKKVVLTTTKPKATGQSRSLTNITYTSVIVLARFAKDIAHADPKLESSNEPCGPQKSIADLNVDLCIQRVLAALRIPPYVRTQRDLKVIAMPDAERPHQFSQEIYQRRRHRAFRAVKLKLQRMGIVTVVERHCVNAEGKARGVLTCLKLCDPSGVDGENNVDQGKMNSEAIVVKVDDEFDDPNAEATFEDEEEDRNSAKQTEISPTKNLPSLDATTDVAVNKVADLHSQQQPKNNSAQGAATDVTRPHLLAEVDIVEQVYQLLRSAGSRGMSVPEISAYLDGGSGLTNTPQKRIRNIINGIKRVVPVVESQQFEGSAMHLKICLAEFSDMNGLLPTVPKTAVAKMSLPTDKIQASRERKSQLARKKNELTSLGLQRQELIVQLLEERKAMVIETLGREIARLENTGLERVDQKVMRRIINGLVAQRRANVITTAKPSIKESNRWQTIRLVVLPHLNETSPEVTRAISLMIARALYGDSEGPHTPKKRKSPETDEVVVTETVRRRYNTPPKTSSMPKSSKDKPPRAPKRGARVTPKQEKREETREEETGEDEPSLDAANADIECTTPRKLLFENEERPQPEGTFESEEQPGDKDDSMKDELSQNKPAPKRNATSKNNKPNKESESEQKSIDETLRDAVVLRTEFRDSRKSSIWRLRAIDCGMLKGRMARIRSFHEKLYSLSQRSSSDSSDSSPLVQHSTVEVARDVAPLATFSVYSYLKEFTLDEYAAIVGLYQYQEHVTSSMRAKKMADVPDITEDEMLCAAGARQIQGLVQALVRLNLMKSTKDAKWVLCGAGIIRDFGKGTPAGVIPHGIIFSSTRAVDVYWKELEQFAHYRYIKSAWKNPDPCDPKPSANDPWSQPLTDLYLAARWKQVQQQAFAKSEQPQYEALLQRLSGVDVSFDDSGKPITSNFITTRMKRFSVEALFDAIHGKLDNTVPKRRTERNPLNAERLLFYSRFRIENEIPEHICAKTNTADQVSAFNASTDYRKDGAMLVVTLSKGSTAIKPPDRRISTEDPFRQSLDKHVGELNGHENATDSSAKKGVSRITTVIVDVEPCVDLLLSVVRRRTISYCQKKSDAPKWTVAMQLAGMKNPKTAETSVEKKQGLSSKDKNQKAVVTVCETTLVQSVVELFALQFALKLLREGNIEKEEMLENEYKRVEKERNKMSMVLRAVMIESKHELHRDKLEIQLDCCTELESSETRRRILEEEFELDGNIRFRPGLSLEQQLALLVERHRQLLRYQDEKSFSHGVIFRESDDEGREMVESEKGGRVRMEVLEQILLSVLQEGWLGQGCGDAVEFLSRLCTKEVMKARDRLVVRGLICVREEDGENGRKCFVTSDLDRSITIGIGRGGGEVMYIDDEKEKEWTKELSKYKNRDDGGGFRFNETELGKAAFGGDGEESTMGMIMSMKMGFFGKENVRFGAIVGESVGKEGIEAEAKEKQYGTSKMTIGMNFSFKEGQDEMDKKANTGTAEIEESASEKEFREQVEKLVQSRGHEGLLLSELLQSELAVGCADKTVVCKAVYHMLKSGRAHRVSIESGRMTSKGWKAELGVVYIWHTHTRHLRVGGDGSGSVLSIWTGVNGKSQGQLLTNVVQSIAGAVGRQPGIAEWQVIRHIEDKYSSVCARACADVIFLLRRHGVLRTLPLVDAGGGPFANAPRLNWETQTQWWEAFVDGQAIVRPAESYLQHCAQGAHISACQVVHVATQLWNF